jgi:hypothetical protein
MPSQQDLHLNTCYVVYVWLGNSLTHTSMHLLQVHTFCLLRHHYQWLLLLTRDRPSTGCCWRRNAAALALNHKATAVAAAAILLLLPLLPIYVELVNARALLA